MVYYNPTKNKYYYGGSMTVRLSDGTLFSGIPSVEQLTEWGFVEYIPPEPPEPPEPTPEDELDPYEALNIITGGIEQ